MKSVALGLASLLLLTTFGCGDCGGDGSDGFDATVPRRDTGFAPYDSSPGVDTTTGVDRTTPPDSATGTDRATGVDRTTPPDATTPTDRATGTDQYVPPTDAGPGVDRYVPPADGGPVDMGARGQPCTGTCPAPYTCVIPEGYTEGICLEACTPGSCSGRNQACEELGPSIQGTYCLDIAQRGESCYDVLSTCADGTECFVTAEDEDGYPSEALCKQICEVGGTGDCTGGETCLSSGYVDVEMDQSGNYVTCDQNPNACTAADGYTCMDLRTGDGRLVQACAREIGWCGTEVGPGQACNLDDDIYCRTYPTPDSGVEPAFGLCGDVCWYICFIPAEWSSSGEDVTLECPNSLDCVETPEGLFPEGVRVCDAGAVFDAGIVPDAARPDTTGFDAGTPDTWRPDLVRPDTAGTDTTPACVDCGGLTFIGECNNDDLSWCDEDGCLRTIACDEILDPEDQPLHCAEYNPSWGYDCLAGEDQLCNPNYPYEPPDPTATYYPGCDPAVGECNQFNNFRCLPASTTPDAGVTTDGGEPCYPCEDVTWLGGCLDEYINVWCSADNCLVGQDCSEYGRHCGDYPVLVGGEPDTWYDCLGVVGDDCNPNYFQEFSGFLCDPDVAMCGQDGYCYPDN